jgi:mono/diheme cytochrome c family protein
MAALRKVGKFLGILIVIVLVLVGGYVAYASATAAKKMSFPNAPYPTIAVSKDPAIIERGRYLARGPAHCAECHGSLTDREHPELLTPDTPMAGGLEFPLGPIATFYAANLTPDPDTGIGKLSDRDVARAVRSGILHDGTFSILMRFGASHPSDDDLGAIISYLRTLPPVKHEVPRGGLKLLGKAMLPMFPLKPRDVAGPAGAQAGAEPTLERGAYLADHVALCTSCHTATDMRTFEPNGPKGGGGSLDESHGSDADMEFVPPNLTSDPSGYTGRASEDTFLQRLHTGRAITSSIMPWENLKTMTDVDLRSIYRYLHTLPPVKNNLGPSYRKKGSWPPKS